MNRTIEITDAHGVFTGSIAALAISIDGQNGVDELEFVLPEWSSDWIWRVDIEQENQKKYVLLENNIWRVKNGDVHDGYATLQIVGVRQNGGDTEVWKSREFSVRVLPSVNAAEAVDPGDAEQLDKIAAQVAKDAHTAQAAAEDASLSAERAEESAIQAAKKSDRNDASINFLYAICQAEMRGISDELDTLKERINALMTGVSNYGD